MRSRGRLHRHDVPEIKPGQWERIAELLSDPGSKLMPHDVGMRAGIDYELARTLLLTLARDKLADKYFLVYHKCSEAPAGRRPMNKGFQPIPWRCPLCDEVVVDSSEISYDMMFEVKCKIEIV